MMRRLTGILVLTAVAACGGDDDTTTPATTSTGTASQGGAAGTGGAGATGGTSTGSGGSGGVAHGDTHVIQGSGFGTRATAEPLLWDDFEAGTEAAAIDGAAPAIGNPWGGWSSGGVDPSYGSANPRHPRSTRHSFHDLDSVSQYNCSLAQSLTATSGDRIYLSYWWRYESTGTEWTDNLKPWVIYDDAGQGQQYVGMSVPGDGLRSGGNADSPTLWGGIGQQTLDGQWIRWEEELEVSSANQADGERHCRVHTTSPAQIEQQWSTDAHQTHAGADWDNIDLGTYQTQDSRSPGARCTFQIDDVYIDRSWARVELGDSAEFANCTHREVQVPSAWSDGEVTITINQGSFSSLDGLHLFVIDSDRQVVHAQPL